MTYRSTMTFEEFSPPLPGMRAWAANCGRYHFVITLEQGRPTWSAAERAEWVGFTASYKSWKSRDQPAVRIDGLWQSFEAAQQACADAWQQLRQAH